MRRPIFAMLFLAACGGATSSQPSAEPTPAPMPTAVETDEPAPTGPRAVVLRHGPMTYVMDSPAGQMRKAAEAIADGRLVAQLGTLEVAVSYEQDAELDDTVVVVADGEELGRAALQDIDGKEVPDELIAAVRAHFQIEP